MILGIDTSNYTTSVCLAEGGSIVSDRRKLLTVKQGERGLRQSDAFYQHVMELPSLTEGIDFRSLDAVCVSDRPRREEGSYMPCFNAGVSFAKVISDGLGIPLFRVSHQMGHIRAALQDSGLDTSVPFLSVHLSGGTTEVLYTDYNSGDIMTRIVCATSDISAGQFIDRIGVAMGSAFPAGKTLDAMFDITKAEKLPVSIKDGNVSFSGVETKVQRMVSSGEYSEEALASSVFLCVGKSVGAMIGHAVKTTGLDRVLIAGGVSSSMNIRGIIAGSVPKKTALYYAPDGMGSDNACGTALLGEEYLISGGKQWKN